MYKFFVRMLFWQLFSSYMYVEKAAETTFIQKKLYVKCWWNWDQNKAHGQTVLKRFRRKIRLFCASNFDSMPTYRVCTSIFMMTIGKDTWKKREGEGETIQKPSIEDSIIFVPEKEKKSKYFWFKNPFYFIILRNKPK